MARIYGEDGVKDTIAHTERQVNCKWQKSNSAIPRRLKALCAGLNGKCNKKILSAKSNVTPSMFHPVKSAA